MSIEYRISHFSRLKHKLIFFPILLLISCGSYSVRSTPIPAGSYAVKSDCPSAEKNEGTLRIDNPGRFFLIKDGTSFGFPTDLAQTEQNRFPAILVSSNEGFCKGIAQKNLLPQQQIIFVCFDNNSNYICSIKLDGQS